MCLKASDEEGLWKFGGNLVLQIQSVPPAVWTLLYQSAFYGLISFTLHLLLLYLL